MHPHNIFSEAVLLFVIAVILFVRDRGSASASTPYDSLLAGILFVLSLVRLAEFIGGSQDGHIFARTIVWLMWLLPIVVLLWLSIQYHRWDTIVLTVLAVGFLAFVFVVMASGSGGYDIIPPDQRVGTSNGIYQWVRTDGASAFLPLSFYVFLAISLIYLTTLSIRDGFYWVYASLILFGFATAAIIVPQIVKDPMATLGSVSTLVMLAVGMISIFLAPG